MTREEAKEVIKQDIPCEQDADLIEAFDMAIQALSQEPCDDVVSRQAVLDEIDDTNRRGGFGCKLSYTRCRGHIEHLPSVTQKYGKWIEHPEIETSAPEYLMFYECSECGDKQCFCKSDIHKKRFCNNCGAKMVEPQERSDKE